VPETKEEDKEEKLLFYKRRREYGDIRGEEKGGR